MMIGERARPNPTVNVPPWTLPEDTKADVFAVTPQPNAFPNTEDYLHADALAALQLYLPSNTIDVDFDSDGDVDFAVDAYSSDHFRMFEFKVRKCSRGRSHDWTECPFAHPGEKARRRDPRKYHYSGTACPEFRKGSCRKGDACEFAHGVFECWLHPARYRTQPCKDGLGCRRRVCFFAHTAEQLRVLSPQSDSYDGASPRRLALEGSYGKSLVFLSSPESNSPPTESPPLSPMTVAASSLSKSLGSNSINDVVVAMRQLQLNKLKQATNPSSWSIQAGSPGYGSPRVPVVPHGFCSLPSTPTQAIKRLGMSSFDRWENGGGVVEELAMERVESGRDLRAKLFERLSRENPLDSGNSEGGDDGDDERTL